MFFLSVFSSSEVLVKILPFGVNCRLQLTCLGEKKRGNCEANLLYMYVKSDFGTTDTTDKSFTVFFVG